MNNYLKTQRVRAGLTQDEVANLVGISSGGIISCYERGLKTPNLPTALRLRILYQVSLVELFPRIVQELEYNILKRIDCAHFPESNASQRNYKLKNLERVAANIVKRNNNEK